MSSKLEILESLSVIAPTSVAMPDITVPARIDDLVGQFANSLATVAGTLHSQDGQASLAAYVKDLIAAGQQVISLCPEVEGNRAIPNTAHELQDIDYAILKGELAVAENGAIWVSQPEGHRVTPFICENLLIMVNADSLVANMHVAMERISLRPGEFGVFIAGPSKTADIEQALVVGAHGACSLNVYLI
ncbi:LUD domain-containing protein [Shewanella sp. NIFS-20-20]|uniref:LutC/YkgG family protein n=1 Tax=Shewanella sp. NIFS-20-20 TaxID=2853806 RepID=UPI001C4764B1|nr:LUD domain-containing protein [Shewanella sp. NIFS-20-20]MBV7315336.1 lactate utilization protein [Shewanella sp. NIFS-20-20]